MSEPTDLEALDDLDDPAAEAPVTVALVHPDASRRSLLERKLQRAEGLELVSATGGLDDGLDQVIERLPDVVALFPDEQLLETVAQLEDQAPAMSVLILDPGPEHFPALAAGARGTLPSGGSEITKAVVGIAHDEAVLTPEWAELLLEAIDALDERVRRLATLNQTEREVLQRLAEGETPREIADAFEVSERLVNLHVGYAVGKYGRATEALRGLARYEQVRDAAPPPASGVDDPGDADVDDGPDSSDDG